jgi:two-component system, cell cycle sensor histidine kinase and response regulator CckA
MGGQRVQDRTGSRSIAVVAERPARAGAIAAGAVLAGAAAVSLWQGAVVIPTALIVSGSVFAIYLGLARLGVSVSLSARLRRSGIGFFENDAAPVFVTDLAGRVVGRNPAAGSGFLDLWSADPEALAYRMVREVAANGTAVEAAGDGRHRVTASRLGSRSILWRVEPSGPRAPRDGAGPASSAVAWLRLDANQRVLASNRAAEAAAGGRLDHLDDLISDGPLRPGGVHVLAATGQAVRGFVLTEEKGVTDVVLAPLDAAEISGLAPDHFLEELPVALARLRVDGELTYANRAARQLLGDGARPGANVTDLIEGLARPIAERLQDTARGRGLGRSEVARGKLDGHEIFLQVAFTRTIQDGAESLLAVLSDATELKTLEAQFVQSQKMQAVGQLAGGVAHDFNNLLTAINGHCDLLLMRHDVADVEHGDLMQIRQNANRAAALVRQLLAFSRKQTLRPTVINLQDTLSELAHLLNRLVSDRVTLRIEHGSDLAPVRVDERQLEQVIMNLVVNARDAMPRGGEVRIATRNIRLAEDMQRDRAVVYKGDYVVIEVADSGSGIPKAQLHKIFEPFYTTKPVGEGTGLGLSTAYGIIKQTGGFIFADSPPGGGAIFSIYLPAYEKADLAPAAEPEPRAPRDLTGRGLVLLVEDEDPVRSFAARALQLRGYTVIEAASGEEALKILTDEDLHVDIMLSDVIMPGLDGPAWVREARKVRPDTKVVFMSGYTEDAFTGGDCGVPGAAFLPKPFTLPELTQRVKEVLEA